MYIPYVVTYHELGLCATQLMHDLSVLLSYTAMTPPSPSKKREKKEEEKKGEENKGGGRERERERERETDTWFIVKATDPYTKGGG